MNIDVCWDCKDGNTSINVQFDMIMIELVKSHQYLDVLYILND